MIRRIPFGPALVLATAFLTAISGCGYCLFEFTCPSGNCCYEFRCREVKDCPAMKVAARDNASSSADQSEDGCAGAQN